MNRAFALLTLTAMAAASQATLYHYSADFGGSQEVPPNSSPGTGFGTFTLDTSDPDAWIFKGTATATGLMGQAEFEDFHQAPPGVAGPNLLHPVYPVGSTSPGYTPTTSPTFKTFVALTPDTDYNGLTREQILTNLNAGLIYTDIHTGAFPGGEIRAQLNPVPEPASVAVLGLGALALVRRRKAAKR